MNASELVSVLKSVPFHSFTIHVADGRSFPVARRDLIMVSPNGRTVDLFQPDGDHDIFRTETITRITFEADDVESIDEPVMIGQ